MLNKTDMGSLELLVCNKFDTREKENSFISIKNLIGQDNSNFLPSFLLSYIVPLTKCKDLIVLLV